MIQSGVLVTKTSGMTRSRFRPTGSSGEIVATFSNGTWHAMGTPAEDARTSEFYGIYREAWNVARGEATTPTVYDTSAGMIDITA
ncbi:hypothetical protein [Lutispora saccharofermentans]|uniref:Uncharacterized protein n=1 Tax=Lutispora saccharofermentans TaxID=3024236 RepID=A0ABT1NEL5_9FIRM|nr:hypothetical protein [Lutispora saccharofermentans]MCQ1529703.1 hypothetical protein [Lutispora saccharofermentans]